MMKKPLTKKAQRAQSDAIRREVVRYIREVLDDEFTLSVTTDAIAQIVRDEMNKREAANATAAAKSMLRRK